MGAELVRSWLTEQVDDCEDGNFPDEERIDSPPSRYFASVNSFAIFFFGRIRVNVGCNVDRSARPLLPTGVVFFPEVTINGMTYLRIQYGPDDLLVL
jgi:hypothetical protein